MIYQGINIESFQLVSYLGEERKHNTRQENQKYFMDTVGELSFSYTAECPIEDMICIDHDDVTGENLSEWEREALLSGLEEIKAIYPNSYISIYLSGFIKDGNCFDITADEFKELYH